MLTFQIHNHSFKTRPGGSTRDWNRAGLKKKQGKEKPGVTRQDPIATR
jgi:hypothetical protein